MSQQQNLSSNLKGTAGGLSQGQSQFTRLTHAQANPDQEIYNLPIRQYLDQAVVPILIQAMSECGKERPANPMQFIIQYLRENNP